MRAIQAIEQKIMTLPQLMARVAAWRITGKKIAFTNGCFDILHEGHIFSLNAAASEADYLIVGVNSDNSVKKIKGPDRPVNNEHSRSLILASLAVTDAIIVFDEDTPYTLITTLLPDALVKGGDYTIEQIVGSKEVIANGGRVVINPIVEGFSTTGIIQHIKQSYS
ncbi:MAG: D-glycero-beta-D-manno-heptose 1-phosphate adenylyltransferase [Sediminibacterium sp.]|uniref:D-glycero-beta-D-manno-heptose 1-phosphate adenylyltransferase n=1 Tax=Sediminibacterium sp. TaxID=1917865 RepID=UPI002ABC2F16|nr:D-glycero-beta-D-manno-heptose 1-phosphate adenylyltransferase [Sediminibacterium sp.]MDZ4071306.1 D-glycero-beta-D-manno-heptose 1-phosphate adenylyltransferase [Sediminibacterium sp.]